MNFFVTFKLEWESSWRKKGKILILIKSTIIYKEWNAISHAVNIPDYIENKNKKKKKSIYKLSQIFKYHINYHKK